MQCRCRSNPWVRGTYTWDSMAPGRRSDRLCWPPLRQREQPRKNGKVITGHSLGAAIATLCWADLGGDLMTFASPRVGDPAFGTALWNGQTVRVINASDIVPDVPTDPPFRHGGTEVKVQGPGGL